MSRRARIEKYERYYTADYGFEAEMERSRHRMLIERLSRVKPLVVLEVGCGSTMLAPRYAKEGPRFDRWVIVEPAERFYALASRVRTRGVKALRGFLEDSVEQARASLGRAPDVVLCSSVLHEVARPRSFLAAARSLMGRSTLLHVNVPSATSLHRRLAKAMGLIRDLAQPSARNRAMDQQVFDAAALRREVERAGLRVTASGGYVVKPFTHAQMAEVAKVVGPRVLDGLDRLGHELPELAAEIYVEARKA